MQHENITVQIMAGGQSRRMGTDKAFVTLGGKTLLERAVDTWKDWGSAVFLSVGGEDREKVAPAGTLPVFDRYPACGPMGGLHGGLLACSTEFILLCAVDSPFLKPEHAQKLVEAIGSSDACVYEIDGEPQPLFGLYRTTCLSVAQTLLMQGELRMTRLLEAVHTVRIPAEDRAVFRNLNTPEDLVAAEQEFL